LRDDYYCCRLLASFYCCSVGTDGQKWPDALFHNGGVRGDCAGYGRGSYCPVTDGYGDDAAGGGCRGNGGGAMVGGRRAIRHGAALYGAGHRRIVPAAGAGYVGRGSRFGTAAANPCQGIGPDGAGKAFRMNAIVAKNSGVKIGCQCEHQQADSGKFERFFHLLEFTDKEKWCLRDGHARIDY
jgi:hypothetical protein